MVIDIYHTRRTNYKECLYWKRNESVKIGDASKWVLENKPEGAFFAKPESEKSLMKNQIQTTMLFDRNSITLSTEDCVDNLETDDTVMYCGKLWGVVNIQRRIHLKESQFSCEDHYSTYITLRR